MRREHFGMSVIEAMQNGAVPVVFDGGGLRESVRHGLDGFRVRDLQGLETRTLALMRSPSLLKRLSRAAQRRAEAFGPERFRREVRQTLLPAVEAYRNPAPPEVDAVRDGRFMADCRKVWDRALNAED